MSGGTATHAQFFSSHNDWKLVERFIKDGEEELVGGVYMDGGAEGGESLSKSTCLWR